MYHRGQNTFWPQHHFIIKIKKRGVMEHVEEIPEKLQTSSSHPDGIVDGNDKCRKQSGDCYGSPGK